MLGSLLQKAFEQKTSLVKAEELAGKKGNSLCDKVKKSPCSLTNVHMRFNFCDSIKQLFSINTAAGKSDVIQCKVLGIFTRKVIRSLAKN
jgi:hypothetical protein